MQENQKYPFLKKKSILNSYWKLIEVNSDIDNLGLYLYQKYNLPSGWSEKYSGVKSRHQVTFEHNGYMGAKALDIGKLTCYMLFCIVSLCTTMMQCTQRIIENVYSPSLPQYDYNLTYLFDTVSIILVVYIIHVINEMIQHIKEFHILVDNNIVTYMENV